MAKLIKDITDLTRGEDAEIILSFPVSAPIASARLLAKLQITDGDGAAAINKTVTTTPTGNGQITNAGVAGGALAVVKFNLTETETGALQAYIDYLYDVETDAATNAKIYIGGKIRLAERIRIAIG